MLTQSELKNFLYYNSETGIFNWVKPLSPGRIKIGDIAGYPRSRLGKDSRAYIVIMINGKTYYAHRLAFLYVNGNIPPKIDHKDRNSINNAWTNLRAVSNQGNAANTDIRKNNTSGYTGVHWDKSRNLWMAYIKTNNKRIHLGRFKNKEDAAKSYNNAAKTYFGEFANLNIIQEEV